MRPGTNSRTPRVRSRLRDLLRGSRLRSTPSGCHARAARSGIVRMQKTRRARDHQLPRPRRLARSRRSPHGVRPGNSAISPRKPGSKSTIFPTPQDNRAQLQLIRDLLQSGASTPDVYGVDSIWPGMLAQYLVDLKPYFPAEMPNVDPEVLATYMIDGKLTGIPVSPQLQRAVLPGRSASQIRIQRATTNLGRSGKNGAAHSERRAR